MSSNQRTYGRKRKDDAEEKFDALFSSEVLKKPITIEIGKVKKQKKSLPTTIASITLKNGKQATFNATSTISVVTTASYNARKNNVSDPLSFSPVKIPRVTKTFVASPRKTFLTVESHKSFQSKNSESHTYKSISNTKYDMLFKKNEKNASDKFDALFGDELGTPVSETQKTSNEKLPVVENPDYESLFGFADSSIIKAKITSENKTDLSQTVFDLDRIPPLSPEKSPIKLSGITGASMKTVGGKVVLNIQKRTKTSRKQSLNEAKSNESSCSSDNETVNNFSSKDGRTKLPGNNNCNKKLYPSNVNATQLSFSKVPKPLSNVDDKLRNAKISLISDKNTPTVPSSASTVVSKQSLHQLQINPQKYGRHSPIKQTSTAKPSYNSRPWMQHSEEKSSSDKDSISLSQPDSYEFDSEQSTPKLIRATTWPDQIGESIVTSLKCEKSAKAYFTVVKHVKNYQNCLEEGETKEFEDEVSYLLEGLQPSQPLSVRCLSVTNFASKCQQHTFRLYLRAHNVVDKVFSQLEDAKEHPTLALSTAALLFMLSRDRQMEINKITLQLLLRLLDPFDKDDPDADTNKQEKNRKQKEANSKYKFFKSKDKTNNNDESSKASTESISKIKHMIATSGDHLLTESHVSVKRLSSEALLRFTARRTVEWFREEIRLKGGLDHIISLVKSHVDELQVLSKTERGDGQEDFKPKTTLCILERLLKVLENAIVNSPRNAMYLVTHQRALLLKKMAKLMQLTKVWLAAVPSTSSPDEEKNVTSTSSLNPYTVLQNSIVQIIKLLVNISNDNEWVSSRVGEQDGMLENIVDCILTIPTMLKEEHRYELILLSLSLLVNLVESSAKNRIALMKMTVNHDANVTTDKTVIKALVELFEEREAAAKENEVLGETGVKKAVAAKKTNSSTNPTDSTTTSNSKAPFTSSDHEGHWVETEDGMEWVPSEESNNVIASSQDSCRSAISTKNPESSLTAEERNEMRETLDKANEHMEDSIVASYAALVLGCLIHGNRANSPSIRSHFSPGSGFSSMITILKKFLSFMSLTSGMSAKGEKTLIEIIEAVEEEINDKV